MGLLKCGGDNMSSCCTADILEEARGLKGQTQAQKGPAEAARLEPGGNVKMLSVFGRSLFGQT